jgi:hypothetical protein
MSSVHVALSQPKTNTLKVGGTVAPMYTLASIQTALAAQSVVAVGSVFVAPSASAITSAVGSFSSVGNAAVNTTLTDLGKTLVVEFNDATVKFREVKYQTAATTFVTGYVVVENNWNLSGLTVLVSRV